MEGSTSSSSSSSTRSTDSPPAEEIAQEAIQDIPDSVIVTIHQPKCDNDLLVSSGLSKPSPATTPEPSSITGSSSLFTSWYSIGSASQQEVYDAKTYKNYVQSIDKCLKNFEYSIEWPDLISALTKLNKVISSFNAAQLQQHHAVVITPPPPLPRTQLITKRLSQCLHPNLPSGVHLKTLETFDLIFQGFRSHDYAHLESDLFSFVSGLLPLWSYAAISVKPKLLSIYETHLLSLKERLRPALNGVMLSLFNGLVDDGVEHDIKIRINTLLSCLQTLTPHDYINNLNALIRTHATIHLPLITHVMQINYSPPPSTLMHLISSPNTLVQRNALELLLKSYDLDTLPAATQVTITKKTLQTLLKRDTSVTRRVFSIIEPRQSLLTTAIESLIQDSPDSTQLTRILSTILDNPTISILDDILPNVVKYLMKCEYNVSISFLSTISCGYLNEYFTNHLFMFESHDDLESRVIVLNYILKLGLFELDYTNVFRKLVELEDCEIRTILQMIRIHYNSHHNSFVCFFNSFMGKFFSIQDYEKLQMNNSSLLFESVSTAPPSMTADIRSESFEFVLELLIKSEPDNNAFKFVILSSCVKSQFTSACIRTYIHFQDNISFLIFNTHAMHLIFHHCYDNDKALLDSLKYPEKYLLSVLHDDSNVRSVVDLDLSNKPLIVLKLVDPVTMDTPYRRFIAENFVSSNGNLVLNSILKYLEFQVTDMKVVAKAKSESNLDAANNKDDLQHACSVVNVNSTVQCCAYDSARVLTLLEKLDFVVKICPSFLDSIDLIVLLSKLTVLSTISNSNEKCESALLQIQTHALRTIRSVVRSHGDATYSFVYDSILNHLMSTKDVGGTNSLLWELSAISVVTEFLKFDLENYGLGSVVQKTLNYDIQFKELHERVQVAWLNALSRNLKHIRKHLNAIVLITFTSVCRNLLEKACSETYVYECVRYLTHLLVNLLPAGAVDHTPVATTTTGFLSSLFGGSNTKLDTTEPGEAMRIAILGKLDLVVKIACRVKLASVRTVLVHLIDNHEGHLMSAISKCFDTPGLENVVKEMKIPVSKICACVVPEFVHEGVNFICKYLRVDKVVEFNGIVSVCKTTGCSRNDVFNLVSCYVRNCGGGGVGKGGSNKDMQDLVVRTIEMTIENREFSVLENHVPGVFDLVWGENAVAEEENKSGAGASNASVRDQKVIVNVVHSIVVALVVAIKGSSSNVSAYNSALHVMEQISHHSYLRKSWKKEIFELITNEQMFFYFTPECLGMWKIIVDNLFTQDRSTFSELITRLTQTTQMSTSALSNIFSSKDSELYETRASLLKRLAFVIHSSEKDQYAKYITNIQEKIAEALKIGGGGGSNAGGPNNVTVERTLVIPAVNNSVFLCFRIMVLKFNCNILTSLWPIIVHEVVMVLTTLQNHLDNPVQQSEATQLSLYLQTLKLLNFLFTLNSDSIPHFQLYKWAFVDQTECNNNVSAFTPYIAKLRATALTLHPQTRFTPALRIRSVGTMEELCTAFGDLDSQVPESEWEVIDFCDGIVDSACVTDL